MVVEETARKRGGNEPSDIDYGIKKSKETATSYKIFLQNIKFDESSKPDVSAIFRREGFLHWLSTRPTKQLKHPAKSYQRVLYAHIRGGDKRRPFTKAVERELLKTIRNVDRNPWKDLFEDEKAALGKRGFKSLGFHEANELKKNLQIQPQDEAIPPENDSKTSSDLAHPKKQIMSILNMRRELEEARKYLIVNISPTNQTVPWDLVAIQIQKFVPIESRERSMIAATKRGFKLWSPAVYFYLNELINNSSNDFRFSWEFLFPSSEEQMFRNDRAIGTLIYGSDNIITHEDESTVELFRGSIYDKHFFQLFASLVAVFYSFIGHLPTLYSTGEIWRRAVLKRNDGSSMVCLMKNVQLGDNRMMYLQDHSEFYPRVLSNVCFI